MLFADESFVEARDKWIYDIAFFRDNCKDKDRYVQEVAAQKKNPIIDIKISAIKEE